MSSERYNPNNLSPIQIDESTLSSTANELQTAIATATALICDKNPPRDGESDRHDSLYVGNCGIALMFTRLALQSRETNVDADTMTTWAHAYSPLLRAHHPRAGHLSPLDSVVGPAMVYVLDVLGRLSMRSDVVDKNQWRGWDAAISTIRNAVDVAINDGSLGGDEVLYGKAGLLWGMLNVYALTTNVKGGLGEEVIRKVQEIDDIVGLPAIRSVFDIILRSGVAEAGVFQEIHGVSDSLHLPLMWSWHGKYYLGAIHGVAGILTVLLQCPRDLVLPHLDLFTSCISALCTLTVQNDGHLPSSLPARHRSHPYVQICHGSPGLIILLSTLRLHFPDSWRKSWDEAERMASEKIWQEGLVKKGLGICHGVSGNAWALLLQSASYGDTKTEQSDEALSRALAMLLHARCLPPLITSSPEYRLPDHPYSLFEGLAGTVCAWADARALLKRRLRLLSTSSKEPREEEAGLSDSFIGFPGLGGVGAVGIL